MATSQHRFTLLRIFTAVLAISVLVFAISGCTSGAPSQSTSAQNNASPFPTMKVASLKGPTTIGLASMMQNTSPQNGVLPFSFEVFATVDEVSAKLATNDVDIALIPANLAATLYNKTKGALQVIDINTLGVLYALTADDALKAKSQPTMADLSGHTIYMSGKGTVPECTLRYLLKAAGVAESSVTIEFCSDPTEVLGRLNMDNKAVGILPQPFATVALAQDTNIKTILDLNEQWNTLAPHTSNATANSRMVTGVTVARTEVTERYPQAISAFLEAHMQSASVAGTDPAFIAEKVVELGIVGKVPVAEKAIPKCNIVCITGSEMKEALAGYLQVLYSADPKTVGGVMPADAFYFDA